MDWSQFSDPQFWFAVVKIIWINILLSGDNAVVIALACRTLPPRQRRWGMIIGAGVAVGLRIVFTAVVVTLMTLPYLKLVGGVALFWIAVKLLVPEDEEGQQVEATDNLWRAVKLVAIADIIMSLDNVIAIAAAAQGSYPLLILGLAISIPLIVAGAALIMALLDRFPVIVWVGGALLGWIAAEVIITDPAVGGWFGDLFHTPIASLTLPWRGEPTPVKIEHVFALAGAVFVTAAGFTWRRIKHRGPIHTPAAVLAAENPERPVMEQRSTARDRA